jgi:ribose 5-phosphate isomerase RpiB
VEIVIGSDHAGLALKRALVAHLTDAGHEVDDRGTSSP